MVGITKSNLEHIRDEFFLRGESVAEWAARQGFPPSLVYQVLSGRCKASRGKSHLIAVRLGLKKPSDPARKAYQPTTSEDSHM